MKITIPVPNPPTPTVTDLRDDWREVIKIILDDPETKQVIVKIPGRQGRPEILAREEIKPSPEVKEDLNANPKIFGKNAVIGRPAVPYQAAISSTLPITIQVWSGDSFDKIQSLNNGGGWLQPDLITAVENILNNMKSN